MAYEQLFRVAADRIQAVTNKGRQKMHCLRFLLLLLALVCPAYAFAGEASVVVPTTHVERADPAAAKSAAVSPASLEITDATLEGEHSTVCDALRLNQVQVIGSHNSFKAAIDPELLKIMLAVNPDAENLNYAHPPLTDQLNLGLRGLELDLFHDPQGGHYASPMGIASQKAGEKSTRPYDPQGKMREPGFKVMHVQDIDFRSNCLTLADALTELRDWSRQNPRHLPILITFNLTDNPIQLPGSKAPVRFDAAAYDALDAQFRKQLGDHLIVPDDVRRESETLDEAIRDSGWPTLGQSRGKFLLVLDDAGRKRQEYLAEHPSLRGRAMFVNSEAGRPESAVMIRNNPLAESKTITNLVNQGYLVRTRADAELEEARQGDLSRFEAAKKSGAQVISTDFYLADWRLNPSYRVRFDRNRCFRLNPVTWPAK